MTPQELYHSICLRYQECEVDSICQTEKHVNATDSATISNIMV